MTEFARHLGLRDQARDSLQPDPDVDVDLYVDQHHTIDRAMARFSEVVPKLVVRGDYGTGKTHLLRVLQSRMSPDRFRPVYVKLEAHGPSGDTARLHDDLVCALEGEALLGDCVSSPPSGLEADVQHAFERLTSDPKDPVVRSWLLARGPTPTQARKAGFTARLFDFARGVRYVKIWRAFASSFKKNTGMTLVFLIDESETFQDVVHPGRAADLGVAFREIFDTANRDFGAVAGLTMPKAKRGIHPLLRRPDVASRVQDVSLDLRPPSSVEDRFGFMKTLLERLSPRPIFSDDGLRFLAEEAEDLLIRRFAVGVTRDPVQRDLVKMLDHFGRTAVVNREPVPIDAATLERWADE